MKSCQITASFWLIYGVLEMLILIILVNVLTVFYREVDFQGFLLH